MIKQVKASIISDPTKKTGKRHFYYVDIPFQGKEWNDVNDYLPAEYDLVLVKTDKCEVMKGWISHKTWDGMKLEEDAIVKYWKLIENLT